jgi:hypothetical protein
MDAGCLEYQKALDNGWEGVFIQFSWGVSTYGSFWRYTLHHPDKVLEHSIALHCMSPSWTLTNVDQIYVAGEFTAVPAFGSKQAYFWVITPVKGQVTIISYFSLVQSLPNW